MSLPARPAVALSAVEADLAGAAIDQFAATLGGRAALLDTLSVANGSPEIDQIARLLDDPRYAGWSLRRLCHLAGITVADLFSAYRKALIVRAHVEATRKIVDALPGVVADVMARSQPYQETCRDCQGTTRYTPEPTKKEPNPVAEPCRACQATGTITILPDLDRQKVALELGQLLQSRTGISIQQNTLSLPPAGGGAGVGTLESLQQAVQAVLYPRAVPRSPEPPIATEGEIVDQPVEPAP